MKKVVLSSVLSLIHLTIWAQIPTVYLPDSSAIEGVLFKENRGINMIQVPAVDIKGYIEEDQRLDAGNNPYRFGAIVPTSINFIEAATKAEISGNAVWKLKITSKNAVSLNVVFEKLELPPDGRLFIYNEKGNIVQGPITNAQLSKISQLSSSVIPGSLLNIEYIQPVSIKRAVKIKITKIIHGYRAFVGLDGNYGTSSACNIDVVCPQGQNWCLEAKTVARLLVNNNAFCTGATLNNVQENFRGFILTANHCLSNNVNNWQFEFHYKDPSCNAPLYAGITWAFHGASLRANWIMTDFALLEMNNFNANANISRLAGIHFAGWSRSSVASQNSTGIHHPKGDVMKISFDNDPAISATWPNSIGNAHWQVHFETGTMEHGSSGAPLFDQNHRIIGQLHGNLNYSPGADYCSIPDGWYGKFDRSWTGNGSSSNRLVNWLDPLSTGQLTTDVASPTVIHHNKQITTNTGLHAATNTMELAGFITGYPVIPFPWSPYPVNGQEFIVYPTGKSSYKAAEFIQIRPGVSVKPGSNFHAYIGSASCN